MRFSTIRRTLRSATAPLTAGALSFLPAAAHAQTSALQRAGNAARGGGLSTGGSLAATVGQLITVALGTVGVIFLLLTIYAGFLWMTAAGDSEKITKAKELLVSAIIGMAVIFGAMAITSFVVDAVTASTGSSPAEDAGAPPGSGS